MSLLAEMSPYPSFELLQKCNSCQFKIFNLLLDVVDSSMSQRMTLLRRVQVIR
jgi:hypothetical protein